MVKKKPDKKSAKRQDKKTPKIEVPKPEIFESYDDENREEWNKKRGEFEELADELSRDHDFIVLSDNKLREKWIRTNYPKQQDVKELVKRAIHLYHIRIKRFSI